MKLKFSLFFCFVMVFFSFSEEIQLELISLLPVEVAKELQETGKIQKSAYKNKKAEISLAPSLDLAQQAVSSLDPASCYFVENLYLYEKKNFTNNDFDIGKTSIILRSLSSLEGIEYYSASKQKMRVLYEKSYSIQSKNDKTKIIDNFTDAINGLHIFALQKDNIFGEYVYEYTYALSDNTVSLHSTNCDSLKKGFVTIIGENNLKANLIVHDMKTHLLIYVFTQAKFLYLPGLEEKLNSSFSNRAQALYDWFIDEYEN